MEITIEFTNEVSDVPINIRGDETTAATYQGMNDETVYEDIADNNDDEDKDLEEAEIWQTNEADGTKNVILKDGAQLQEDDEILTAQQVEDEKYDNELPKTSKLVMKPVAYHWPKQGRSVRVPYTIIRGMPSHTRNSIRSAAETLKKDSCIEWVEKPLGYTGHHVKFIYGSGCYSQLGFNQYSSTNYQELSVGRGCGAVGKVLHEMLHTMGFFHTQSRPDRDNYIKVIWNHIKNRSTNERNFKKQSAYLIDTLGEPYDYKSIMHYGSNYLAKRRWFGLGPLLRTMETKKGDFIAANRKSMSSTDLRQLNHMYKCN